MKLRFTQRSVENIADAAEYIRARNPAAAESVRAAVYEALQTLILFPAVGRQQDTEGVRKIVTKRYSYLIYYTIDATAEEIVILSVKHPAREREYSDR
jgi:plasmid stabilization system protein ParE